jgi:hypothetical protein
MTSSWWVLATQRMRRPTRISPTTDVLAEHAWQVPPVDDDQIVDAFPLRPWWPVRWARAASREAASDT